MEHDTVDNEVQFVNVYLQVRCRIEKEGRQPMVSLREGVSVKHVTSLGLTYPG